MTEKVIWKVVIKWKNINEYYRRPHTSVSKRPICEKQIGRFSLSNQIYGGIAVMKDQNNASFAYSVGLLKILLEMQLITEEEYKKIVRISAAHYDAESICV